MVLIVRWLEEAPVISAPGNSQLEEAPVISAPGNSQAAGLEEAPVISAPDNSQVAGLEEEQEKVVPSKSDVLDILNTASFGSNIVNSDNLKQVRGLSKRKLTLISLFRNVSKKCTQNEAIPLIRMLTTS